MQTISQIETNDTMTFRMLAMEMKQSRETILALRLRGRGMFYTNLNVWGFLSADKPDDIVHESRKRVGADREQRNFCLMLGDFHG